MYKQDRIDVLEAEIRRLISVFDAPAQIRDTPASQRHNKWTTIINTIDHAKSILGPKAVKTFSCKAASDVLIASDAREDTITYKR
jgi:hypothetical protein